jgi:hypothetical protein
MNTIFTLGDDDGGDKINMDELYEKKQISDMNKLDTYNKILNRIHIRIKTISRQNVNDQFCWFLIPEVIIGVPKYDCNDCITYIFSKLEDNGFKVKYTHPNLLFICWNHWIPQYVRTEIKKKTGQVVDGYGNPINKNANITPQNPDEQLFMKPPNKSSDTQKQQGDFKQINSYKPTGNLIYNNALFNKLGDKLDK